MALVDDRALTMADAQREPLEPSDIEHDLGPRREAAPKKIFLLAAFRYPGLTPESGPITGMAEDVVAVIGMDGPHQRFEWVGEDQLDSVANPALVTPVEVRLALPSPWHPNDPEMVTGLVPLAPGQLGAGSLDEDIDHLLRELSNSR